MTLPYLVTGFYWKDASAEGFVNRGGGILDFEFFVDMPHVRGDRGHADL